MTKCTMTNETHLSADSLRAITQRFLAVFAVLMIGTVATVAMYYVHFEHTWQTVSVALLIAAIKAACVAAIFMHLSHAERSISLLLFFTAIFFAAMLGFLVYSIYSIPG